MNEYVRLEILAEQTLNAQKGQTYAIQVTVDDLIGMN